MKRSNNGLMALGQAIRGLQDGSSWPDRDDIDPQLFRVDALSTLVRWRRSIRWLLLPALGVALVGGVLLMAAVRGRARPLSFDIGGGPGVAGQLISTENATPPLRFSDGSVVLLGPNTRARIEQLDSTGARIGLHSGSTEVNVVHGPTTRWNVHAGPFTVAVLGTHFSLGWDPSAQRLELTLHEGAVTLSGPVVGEQRRVSQGETVAVFVRDGRLETRQHVEPLLQAGAELSSPRTVLAPGEEAGPSQLRSVRPPPLVHRAARPHGDKSSAGSLSAWRTLALANHHRQAVRAADATGFDLICRSADASDLRLLGDTARLAGVPARARKAFEYMRSRFARSEDAATASFLLGKLSFDNLKAYNDAARWFSVYLEERPEGSLAREAAGRLIEARRRAGDRAGARNAAHRYLATYPSGPHAALAHKVSEE